MLVMSEEMKNKDEQNEVEQLDLTTCMEELRKKRRIFHSEADFQFALAWEIQKEYPKANIRLEYPVGKMDIDIVVFCGEDNKKMIPIELKWLRTDFKCCINGEKFQLALSGADPEIRYDCLKDIERIESISKIRDDFVEGYTIWISNIETHFNEKHKYTMQFDISQDKIQTGEIKWQKNDQGEIKNINDTPKKSLPETRKKPFKLNGEYKFKWIHYSIIAESEKNNIFKYCITKIKITL